MSMIDKLGISGIRSYGTKEEVIISFPKPLCIILGANGSGKTTIIEALKMALTGELPPNVSKGSAFIHDPSIEAETETKAQIRLQFTTTQGRTVIAYRKFQLTNKANKKQEFKSVDQSAEFIDRIPVLDATGPNGPLLANRGNRQMGIQREKILINNRCSDLNKILPNMLGVSKAILENVILVHQEDSFWPLADTKELKRRFDDIFASTRYSKGLEFMRKKRRMALVESKQQKTEVELWKTRMDHLNKVRNEYEQLNVRVTELELNMEKLKSIMDEIEAQLEKLKLKECAITEKKAERQVILASMRAKREQLSALEKTLTKFTNYSQEESNNSLDALLQKMKTVRADIDVKARKIEDLKIAINRLSKEREDLKMEKVKMAGDFTAQAARIQALKEHFLEIDGFLDRDLTALNVAESEDDSGRGFIKQAGELLNRYEQRFVELQNSFLAEKAAFDKLALECNDMENEAKVKENSLKEKCASLDRENAEKSMLLLSKRDEMDALAHGTGGLEQELLDKREKLKQHEALLRENASDKRSQEFQKNLAEKRKVAEAKSNQLTELFDERSIALRDEETFNQLVSDRKQVEQKKLTVANTRRSFVTRFRLNSTFEHLGMSLSEASIPEDQQLQEMFDNVQRHCEKQVRLASSEVETTKADCMKFDLEMQAAISADEALKKQKQKLENEVTANRSELLSLQRPSLLENICDTKALASLQAQWKADLARAVEYFQHGDVSKKVFAALIAKALETRTCPTCSRRFETDAELQRMIRNNEIRDDDKEIQNMKKDQEILEQSLAIAEILRDLQENLDALNQELQNKAEIVDMLNLASTERQLLLQTKKDVLRNAEEARTAFIEIEKAYDKYLSTKTELALAENALASLKQRIGGGRSVNTRTVAQIDEEISTCRTELTDLNDAITKYDSALQKERDKMIGLESRVHALRSEVTELDARLSKRMILTDLIAQLEADLALIDHHRKEARKEALIAKQSLQRLLDENKIRRERASANIKEKDERVRKLEKNKDSLRSLFQTVSSFAESIQPSALQAVTEKIASAESKIAQYRKNLEEVEKELEHDKKFVNTSEMLERNLRDNIERLRLSYVIEELEHRITQFDSDIAALVGSEDLEVTMTDLQSQLNSKTSEYHSTRGMLENVLQSRAHLKKEYMKLKSQGSEEGYRSHVHKLVIQEKLAEDLDILCTGLDNSLMAFHSMKMAQINAFIKELWHHTYRGTEIDSIEIVSDVDEAMEPESTSAPTRRSYNYRVVMHVGDASMDMRGRCSAGQKVLACLVIRMALAESFCHECGILALDEPTTNLDKNTMESLAASLADVVRVRKRQSNFQLLLITHDETFIDLLGSRELSNHYLKVYVDDNGHSKVKTCSISELLP